MAPSTARALRMRPGGKRIHYLGLVSKTCELLHMGNNFFRVEESVKPASGRGWRVTKKRPRGARSRKSKSHILDGETTNSGLFSAAEWVTDTGQFPYPVALSGKAAWRLVSGLRGWRVRALAR